MSLLFAFLCHVKYLLFTITIYVAYLSASLHRDVWYKIYIYLCYYYSSKKAYCKPKFFLLYFLFL